MASYKKRKTDDSDLATSSPVSPKPRNPVFDDLSTKYPTVESLEEHLKSLSRPALEALIMSGAFPQAASELRHCVYCHKTFHASDNDLGGCSVQHFMRYKDLDGDVMEWQCCGNHWSDADCDDWMESAEKIFPDCYVGRHWQEEIRTDDEADVEKHNSADYMDVHWNPRAEKRVAWWRQWKMHGNTCEKMGCRERLNS